MKFTQMDKIILGIVNKKALPAIEIKGAYKARAGKDIPWPVLYGRLRVLVRLELMDLDCETEPSRYSLTEQGYKVQKSATAADERAEIKAIAERAEYAEFYAVRYARMAAEIRTRLEEGF